MTLQSIIGSDNIHSKETRQGLQVLKELTKDLNNWELTLDKEDVKLYQKKLDDTNLPPLVRGDTKLNDIPLGCTPLAVATVATLPGCRKIWDEKYEESQVKEYYTRYESLFWVKLKAPWPISPRDFAGTSIRDNEPDTSYCSMLSVKDDRIPNTSGTVRGTLITSGWKITKVDGEIHISYVNQVDLAGYIPASFLKKLLQQIPLCAGKVRDYIQTYGFVPTTVIEEGKGITFKGEEFDHNAKKYTLELDCHGEGGTVDTLCSERMYKNGVQVELQGQGELEETFDEFKNPRTILKNLKGPIHLIIQSK